MTPGAALAELDKVAAGGDAPVDLARAALALAVLERPDRDVAPHQAHLAELAAAVADAAKTRAPATALSDTIAEHYGYTGDADTYDDLANADLASVIERRRGLPVALGILYCHAARAQGWQAVGLNTPAHFLIQIQANSTPVVLDPFHDGAVLSSAGIHGLLRHMGMGEAPNADMSAPVSDRQILLRLQNNIKLRRYNAGDTEGMLRTLGLMRHMAPGLADLVREQAEILAQAGALRGAGEAVRGWLDAGHGVAAERQEMQTLLASIGTKLN